MRNHYFRLRSSLLLVLTLALFSTQSLAVEELQLDESYWDEDKYVFSEHLEDSESWIRIGKNVRKEGVWKKDRFLFPGTATSAEVSEVVFKGDGEEAEEKKAIRINTLKGIKRSLEFSQVPAASKLNLTYKVESERKKFEGINYVNFRVWLGQKQLKEIRIENEPQEKTLNIPLGIYSFLNREGVFRFEVFSDNETPILFSFNAELVH